MNAVKFRCADLARAWAPVTLGIGLLLATGGVLAADIEGTLAWERRVALGVPVDGVIAEVLVQEGAQVDSGQPLLRLDRRLFQATVARSRALVESLGPERDEARRELERAQDLYDRTLLSDHELEMARLGHTRADAGLRVAEADLEKARLALQQAELRAPFAALVVRRLAERGQVVVNGLAAVPLLVVADSIAIVARAYVGEEELAGLRAVTEVTVEVAGRQLRGSLRAASLEPEQGPDGGYGYRIDVLLAQPADLRLRAGQRAILRLP